MEPIVTLRRATTRDRELCFAIRKAALGPYIMQVWGWDDAAQRAAHRRRFRATGVAILCAGGEEVGMMSVARGLDVWTLDQLYLLPEHQGRGLGASCLRRVIEDARAAGAGLQLQVLQVNTRAAAFYQRLGFEPLGTTETHFRLALRGAQSKLRTPRQGHGAR